MNIRIGIFLALLAFAMAGVIHAQEHGVQTSAAGRRIEQEGVLAVPTDRADALWAFLEQTYVRDTDHLKRIDPALTSYWNLEEFTDIYYDTPTLQLLAEGHGARHRRRVNLTNPSDKKSGQELMQIKVSSIDENPLNRGEFKFDIRPPDAAAGSDDAHPMLHLVKPSERSKFKTRLKALNADPYVMRSVLTLHDMRSRIYLERAGQSFMSLSLDRAEARLWWARAQFIGLDVELNEVTYTDADAATKGAMEDVLGRVVSEITDAFPDLRRDMTPKYNKAFGFLGAKLPLLPLLVRANLHTLQGMILVFAGAFLFLIALAYFFMRKRLRPKPLAHEYSIEADR